MRTSNYVLNTCAASAGDISLAGSILGIKLNSTVTRNFNYQLIRKGSLQKITAVSEVLQVSTVTVTHAANKVFAFTLQQRVGDRLLTNTISVDTTNPNYATAADIYTAMNAAIVLLGYKITPSGTSPLTLTALTRYPQFTIVNISNCTIATGTAGVFSVNKGQDLLDQGFTDSVTANLPVSANAYTRYRFVAQKEAGDRFGSEAQIETEEINWYINDGDGNAAALITRFDRWLSGLDNAGTSYQPEAYSQT